MNLLYKILAQRFKRNPPGLYVVLYTEIWELFGRFAITALLVLYLTHTFHVSDEKAFVVYSTFMALIFATPILGGVLADRYLGSKRAIILGAMFMIIGNGLMVFPVLNIVYLGLAIVTVGFGFFLPSLPVLLSAIYDNNQHKREAGFTLYYLGKNIGALLAPIICGFVGAHYGWNYAFILSSIGMATGLVVFVLGQRHLKEFYRLPKVAGQTHPRRRIKPAHNVYLIMVLMVPACYLMLFNNLDNVLMVVSLIIVIAIMLFLILKAQGQARKNLLLILISLVAVIVFMSMLNMGGTTLNLFIQRIINRHIFGIEFPTSAFYALDPIFMLIVGPFLATLWVSLSRRRSSVLVTDKFALGMAFLGLGFLVFVVAATHAIRAGDASPWFVVLAYFLFPIGELCIMPLSLSLVTRLAPRGQEALLVSVWMLANAVAGFLTGTISKYGQINFKLDSKLAIIRASHVYHHLFLYSAIALFVVAGILFVLRGLVQRLSINDGEKVG